jgi:hypothetical protein
VRFADLILRQGHLSERAITDAVMSGNRPAHLDRCDVCASRAVDLARWLDETRAVGIEAADAVFSSEQLSAQRSQIMRKLEQMDEPAPRVISVPRHTARVDEPATGRRVAASWVAVAAAAGLVVGVVGGQISARLTAPVPPQAEALNADAQDTSARPADVSFLQHDYDDVLTLRSLELLDEITPRVLARGR